MVGPGAVDDGFHEVLVIVHDLAAAAERLCGVFGYVPLWSGASVPGSVSLLGVDPATPAREILIGDPAQGRGFLRLMAFEGVEAGVMRDGGQPWDIGGIFDINIRPMVPVEGLHRAMTRAGFCAFSPITAFDFDGYSVKQVVSRDSDGLAIALIERVSPPLAGFENVTGPASFVFNSTQRVPSREEARALYQDALGWQVAAKDEWNHAPSGLNCLGMPLDMGRERTLRVAIFHPKGELRGSVEVLELDGQVLDFSAAAPPARGLAALRFPVSDAEDFLAAAARGGCALVEARRLRLEPYGEVLSGAAVTPWGARLEAYQLI